MLERALTRARRCAERALIVLAACTVLPGVAHAAESGTTEACGDEGPPIVELEFAGRDWEPSLARGIVRHLRAGLEPAGFRVCTRLTGAKPPVATVELRQRPGERVVATIEVRDGVTAKRVARDIDLSALPEDGRALGVGVAADELLRASWAELALRDAPPPVITPPPAVQRAVERSVRTDVHEKWSALGARGAVEGYGGGLFVYGGDAFYRQYLVPRRFGAELALGVRGAPSETSVHGSVAARAFGVGGALFLDVFDRAPWKVALEAGVWAARLELQGDATAGGSGSRAAETLLTARGGASIGLALSSALSLALRAGAGGALRSVSARDDGADVVAASGFEWYAAFGPRVAF